MAFMRFGSSKSNPASQAAVQTSRRSGGLDQFFAGLPAGESQSILDMSGASQANISFITGLGHRLSSDDVVGTMEQCFGQDFLTGQQSAANAQRFLDQTLRFADHLFDGVLVWDILQYLTSPLLEQVVAELLRVTRPGGLLLVFFSADERATSLPVYNFRIQDQKTLVQSPRLANQRGQFLGNRTVEKLFDKSASLKFFLTRDSLREILIRR